MPAFKPLPDFGEVDQRLYICRQSPSGLRWRVSRGRQAADSVAGSRRAYWIVNYGGHLITAQRLVWLLHHGTDPGQRMIDHINRDPYDNRAENLRLADHSDNAFNTGLFAHNTTGVRGVSFHNKDQVFYAQIKLQQKTIHLGSFKTLEAAAAARKAAELACVGGFSALDPYASCDRGLACYAGPAPGGFSLASAPA